MGWVGGEGGGWLTGLMLWLRHFESGVGVVGLRHDIVGKLAIILD